MTSFTESEERQALRREVAKLAAKLRPRVVHREGAQRREDHRALARDRTHGYLGINLPEEYGGGGGGIGDIAAVCEELAAQGCPLLLMVVSPAICGTIINRFGTEEQKRRWLPGIADGTGTMAFAHHRARRRHEHPQHHHDRATRRRRVDADRPQDLHLRGRRGRQRARRRARPRTPRPARSSRCCSSSRPMPRASSTARSRWRSSAPSSSSRSSSTTCALPADALVGDEDGGLVQLFAGLNPERIMAASFSTGLARFALDRAASYAKERTVFQGPIGTHQASRIRWRSRRSRSSSPG